MARFRAREPLAGQNRPENGNGHVPEMMMDRIPIKLESQTRIPLITPPMRKGFPAMRRSLTLRRFRR
ncbi:Hypothetical predicted protein, partial [Pelobates cultripes]